MSNVCPGCGKFAGLEEPEEAEVENEQVNDDGTGEVEVRIVRTSSCCGEEMKEAHFTLEFDASDELASHYEEHHGGEDPSEPEISVDLEPTSRTQSKDRHGKPIKSFRYMRTFFGVKGTVTVSCGECHQEVATCDVEDEVMASGMDELN